MNLAWYVSIALHAVLLARLVMLGIWRNYRALAVFLVIAVARSLLLAAIPLYTLRYFYAWCLTEPVIWCAAAGVAIEVYRRLCAHYQGIERVSKLILMGTLTIAAIAAAAPLFFEQQFLPGEGLLLLKALMFVAKRFVFTALAVFVAAIVAFSLLHPESIRRNVRVYGVLTALYFTADAAQALAATAARSVFAANALVLPLSAALIAAWISFMRSAGEKLEARGPAGNRQAIDALHSELVDAVRQLRP